MSVFTLYGKLVCKRDVNISSPYFTFSHIISYSHVKSETSSPLYLSLQSDLTQPVLTVFLSSFLFIERKECGQSSAH